MPDVTQILAAAQEGDPKAAAELLPLVYDELRRLAVVRLASEKLGHTLQPTALVHEAYVRLVGAGGGLDWTDRGHFFGSAAEAMRRILVEAARRKARVRHGGGLVRHDVARLELPAALDDDVLAVDDALTRLAAEAPDKAELVKLRFFAGLTLEQAAACQGVSLATAKRRWAVARAWLYLALSGKKPDTSTSP